MRHNDKKYFIDSHCHLFNVEDIPIFTLLARVNLDLLKFGALFLNLNEIREQYRRFFIFFESQIDDNIERLTGEIDAALGSDDLAELKSREKILCPLVMDFEKIGGCEHKELANQVKRLWAGISESSVILKERNFRILPFLGLDFRRFKNMQVDTIPGTVKDMVEEHAKKRFSISAEDCENGDICGIKLYPALGFDPYPEDEPEILEKYLAVIRGIHALGLPITVHCQPFSYQPEDVSNRQKDEWTSPTNWLQILNAGDDLGKLRINFAHFGGDHHIKRTVRWDENKPRDRFGKVPCETRLRTSTWTSTIIQLLKQHENTFADISAFDFRDSDGALALAWLLVLDEAGKLDEFGDKKLKDKLLWGSDYPMLLGEEKYNDYRKLFTAFSEAMDIPNLKHKERELPRRRFGEHIPTRNDLLDRLTNVNPGRFLFGS